MSVCLGLKEVTFSSSLVLTRRVQPWQYLCHEDMTARAWRWTASSKYTPCQQHSNPSFSHAAGSWPFQSPPAWWATKSFTLWKETQEEACGGFWFLMSTSLESCAFLWWWPRSPEPLYNFLSGCSFADKPVWIMNEATQQSSCVSVLLLVTSHLLNVSVIQALRIPRCIGERRRRTDKKCCWKVRHGFYRSVKRRYCVVGMCTQCVASAGLCDKLM